MQTGRQHKLNGMRFGCASEKGGGGARVSRCVNRAVFRGGKRNLTPKWSVKHEQHDRNPGLIAAKEKRKENRRGEVSAPIAPGNFDLQIWAGREKMGRGGMKGWKSPGGERYGLAS